MSWLKIKKFLVKTWPLVFIFLVVVIFFWKFIFKGLLPVPADTIVGMYHPWRDVIWDGFTAGVPFKNFLVTDPVRQQIPWRQLVINSFKQGQLPLWNPYSLTGTPLLANFQSAPFYIFNLLFFFLNSKIAWGLLIFLQPLLAGIFLYFYLSHLKLKRVACLLGGLGFAFSGFFVAWLEWGTVLHSALWLPLILLSIDKVFGYFNKAKFSIFNFQFSKWAFVFVFSLSQSFFAGHLQVFFYVFLFSGVYLLWRFYQVKSHRLKTFLLFVIFYSLFLIITSFQWRPTLQFIKLSARGVDQANWQKVGWFIPWQHLIQFLVPDFFGNPATLNYWGIWNYAEFIGFIGVVPLLFVFWAIFSRHNRLTRFFLILGLVILSFALPTPWAKLVYQLRLPLISTSQPTRLLVIVDFCLIVLAAFGLDIFLKKKKAVIFPLLFLVIYGFLWLFVLMAPRIWSQVDWIGGLAISQRNLILPTMMLLAGVGLTSIKSIWQKKFLVKIALASLLFLTCFDLIRFGWKFTPFVKKDWLFPSTKTIEFLRKDKDIFRLMSTDRRIFPPNFFVAYRFQTIDGYDPLFLQRYAELIVASERGESNISPPFGFNRIITPQNYRSRLIDLMNVKYILSLTNLVSPKLELVFQEGETRVYQNKNVFSRAFMVYDHQVAKSKQEAINLVMDEQINLHQKAILEKQLAEPLISVGKPASSVTIKSYQSNSILIEVQTVQKGILILTDAFYPGWKATVDGQEAEIYRADYHFRGIIVPEGSHQIVFKYEY